MHIAYNIHEASVILLIINRYIMLTCYLNWIIATSSQVALMIYNYITELRDCVRNR